MYIYINVFMALYHQPNTDSRIPPYASPRWPKHAKPFLANPPPRHSPCIILVPEALTDRRLR